MRSRPLAKGIGVAAISAAIAAWAAVRAPSREPAPATEAPSGASSDEARTSEPSLPSTASSAASTGATPGAGATGDPAPASVSASGTSSAAAGGLARAASTEPAGVHVALDAKLVVRFDRPVAPEGVTIAIQPPADGKRSWPDPQTLVFAPSAWHEGIRHHIQVGGPGVEPVAFEFTTLAPPPERVEPGGGSKVTLTFDDGAKQAAHVTALLDLLEKEEIEAIFFPTGYWAETHPRLIERMREDGHEVCNHTYSHQNLRLPHLTDDAIRKEIAKGAGAGTCKLFRPPMRAYDDRVERIVAEMGYTMYLWDVDSRDWEGLPAEDMVHRILKRVRPGSVVLFHMHSAETLKALPLLIPRLRKAGYVFKGKPPPPSPSPIPR